MSEPTKKIGTLIDPSAIDKNLTARQHLSLISTASNIDPNRVDEMIKITGLEMVQNNKVKSYSLGMKQRLGVATALISDPDVVILDEPNHFVIIIEHNLDFIAASDWIIELGPGGGKQGGSVIFEGTPEVMLNAETLSAKWLKKVVIQ
ncbi:MAG TPA: ATP-binding cassette domain-containing protein [Bacillota bacterium]|nr:ATP-binding cassette domain-containing protein [Bacillota bacterium]